MPTFPISRRKAGKLPYEADQEPADKATYRNVKPDTMGNKGETDELPMDGGESVYHMDSAQVKRSKHFPK